jgi:NADH-quinone oxidoreductase subunit L
MWEEGGFYRFFAYLNLFMFFMLTLVLASNYLLMFIGWEGVGLASYLLIGFWFTKDSAAAAGKKAFIVNRIGDFGFLIALFLLIKHFGTLNFDQVFQGVVPMGAETGGAGLLTAVGLLLMVGAGRQVGPDSALRVAARRHGRPDPGLRADSRCDHGDRGRIYGFAIACDF